MQKDAEATNTIKKGIDIMKIFSEKTKKCYPTVEACMAAEEEFDIEQARIAEERKKLAEARKERAKEVEEAYKEAMEAQKKFYELRNQFVKDYGSFHMTVRNTQSMPSFMDDFFSMFF